MFWKNTVDSTSQLLGFKGSAAGDLVTKNTDVCGVQASVSHNGVIVDRWFNVEAYCYVFYEILLYRLEKVKVFPLGGENV